YRKLVEGIDHSVAWTADESLRLKFMSRQASTVLGYTPEDFLQLDFWSKHLHPDDREPVLALFQRTIAEGGDHMINHRILASDGRVLWFHTGVSGDRAADGASPELQGISMDVTELKRAEEEARRAKESRDHLISIVSHDLRTPLSAIAVSAQM